MRIVTSIPVLVPGWHGSGPGHWQAIWHAANPNWGWIEQRDWELPDRGEWLHGIDRAVANCSGRVVIVAHSLGCIAFAWWASWAPERVRQKVEGAFLVAPSDVEREDCPPELRSFAPAPRCPLPIPTMLIASENDPFMTLERATRLANSWGSTLVNAGSAGHINIASGHGPWPAGKALLDGFILELALPVWESGRKLHVHRSRRHGERRS